MIDTEEDSIDETLTANRELRHRVATLIREAKAATRLFEMQEEIAKKRQSIIDAQSQEIALLQQQISGAHPITADEIAPASPTTMRTYDDAYIPAGFSFTMETAVEVPWVRVVRVL